jgi:hypothetical protein
MYLLTANLCEPTAWALVAASKLAMKKKQTIFVFTLLNSNKN